MKVYKLDEKLLKKKKVSSIIGGILFIIVGIINCYMFVNGYSRTVAGTVFFLVAGFSMLSTTTKLDKFYFELEGTVLTSYLRGKKFSSHDLTKVDVEIKNHDKKPKITIMENGKVKAIHNAGYVGLDAFNEMIKDVNEVINRK